MIVRYGLFFHVLTMKQFHGMTARNGSEYVGESKDLIITAMVEFTLENDA